MATFEPFIGRREAVGLGIEGTVGTSVAPQIWMRWLDQDLQDKIEIVENESALGIVEKVNDSEVVSTWAEGKIGGKVTSETVGFLLLGTFGSVSTGAAVGGIYPHTFSVNQSSIPKALTLAISSPSGSKRYSYGTFDSFELSAEEKSYVMVSCAVKARKGATSSETVAFTTEKEFTSKDIVLKTASSTAGLGAAPAISAKSLKLNIERPSEKFDPLGATSTPVFDRGVFEAKGEFVVRYTDDQIAADFLANTAKAMSITLTNGTTTLSFTASKVTFRELGTPKDRDSIVTQTIQFYCEFDTTAGSAIVPVLNNSRTTYVAA